MADSSIARSRRQRSTVKLPVLQTPVTCVVCGIRTKRKIPYSGGACCPGCCSFFAKSMTFVEKYSRLRSCVRQKSCCRITKYRRNYCGHCRLKRCIIAGMHPIEGNEDVRGWFIQPDTPINGQPQQGSVTASCSTQQVVDTKASAESSQNLENSRESESTDDDDDIIVISSDNSPITNTDRATVIVMKPLDYSKAALEGLAGTESVEGALNSSSTSGVTSGSDGKELGNTDVNNNHLRDSDDTEVIVLTETPPPPNNQSHPPGSTDLSETGTMLTYFSIFWARRLVATYFPEQDFVVKHLIKSCWQELFFVDFVQHYSPLLTNILESAKPVPRTSEGLVKYGLSRIFANVAGAIQSCGLDQYEFGALKMLTIFSPERLSLWGPDIAAKVIWAQNAALEELVAYTRAVASFASTGNPEVPKSYRLNKILLLIPQFRNFTQAAINVLFFGHSETNWLDSLVESALTTPVQLSSN